MTLHMRLTLFCVVGSLAAGLGTAAMAQEAVPLPVPQEAGSTPQNGGVQPDAAPAFPTEQRQAPPSGCPYRNQKLELIA